MIVAAPPVAGLTLGELAKRWNVSRRDALELVLGREGFVALGVLEELVDGDRRRYRLTDRGLRLAQSFAEAGDP